MEQKDDVPVVETRFQTALKEIEDPSVALPEALKYYAASRIFSAVESCFAHWEGVPDLCHAELYLEYLQSLKQVQSRYDFFLATRQYMAHLKNGHTSFYDSTIEKWSTYGFWARPMPVSQGALDEKKWVVCFSTHTGLSAGDIIEEVNDVPACEFFAGYAKYISASRTEAADYFLLLGRNFLLPSKLKLTLSCGKSVAADREANNENPLAGQKAVRFDLSGKHPYLAIGSFDRPEFEDRAVAYIDQIKDRDTLIVDVRGNGGGSTPMKLLQNLCVKPIPPLKLRTRQFNALELANINVPLFLSGELNALNTRPNMQSAIMMDISDGEPVEPSATPFGGKLVVLCDVGSCSATEDLLMRLKYTGRATIVGETSAGSTGQPYFDEILPDMTVQVSTKRVCFPDGAPFEGGGVQPDYPVAMTAEDIKTGHDPVLAFAEELFARETKIAGPIGVSEAGMSKH
ncbi:Peptidase family S41 [Pseudovibrio axinellae]|uniref:Peptidase family S41 n=1 Tax=Pseudovibrio axinellae TaxID=989403 RepID=A0A166A341_9HYPH|nr:S41 family peptidase [Pseudovibrio axinellae]KZL20579.1 Peptidase family S41 [Pseudovibrio axinellae]SER28762.1 carboxyl-terminal processing protease [Pseudovibrio axinellae]